MSRPTAPASLACQRLQRAYTLMRQRFGHQNWWPGETPFEVCVGAILTQNTNWANVERAIGALKQAHVLTPRRLYRLPLDTLAQIIRPAGYFNVKARRLRAFLEVLVTEFQGEVSRMLEGTTDVVRQRLLKITGIGPETADSMLLYAAEHHRFVIDAYTRRIFARHGWCPPEASYDTLQQLCETLLRDRVADRLDYYRDYHAQLVAVGKHHCRPRNPQCATCPLEVLLPGGLPLPT